MAADEPTIHVLISDVIMPEMTGPELHDTIERIHPDLPVIFMSGYPGESLERRGILRDRGMFVQKPFSVDDFLAAVREILASTSA